MLDSIEFFSLDGEDIARGFADTCAVCHKEPAVLKTDVCNPETAAICFSCALEKVSEVYTVSRNNVEKGRQILETEADEEEDDPQR